MADIPLEAIQNCEFGILQYIRDICEQNGLRYYLAYGTLIGAVRHQGFIPWDDDIDVHMPRKDYMRLTEIVAQHPHPFYRLISRETSSRFSHIVAKMIDTRTKLTQKTHWSEKVQLGLFVDIFVLDGAGNTTVEAEATYWDAFACYLQWEKAVTIMFPPGWDRKKSFNKWCHHIPAKILGVRYFINKHAAICMQRAYDDYQFVGALAAGTREASRNIWKREWFGDGIDVLFNGETFRAPSNYDAVLRPEYGEYMKLPPPAMRVAHHPCVVEIPNLSLFQ